MTVEMWIYAAVIAIAALSIAVMAWQLREQNQKIEQLAIDNQRALCSLRADLERRVTATKEFLKNNPQGIPGIPNETIQQTLAGQRSTIEALSFVDCP